MTSMRAAQVTRLDGPDAVEVVELPEPAGTEVVIEVAAAGICFPDVLLTRGQYQITPDLPFVPGSEVAGLVRSAPVSSGYAAGDRVAAFPFLGGFAEVVEADAAMVFPLPDSVTFEQGAALPMNYLTCHFALRERGRLREGETVLVQGAAGGIGTAAVQLAAAWGARVIADVASTSWSTPSAATASPTRCARSRPEAGCSSSASPRARSRRSRSTACCWATSRSSASGGVPGGPAAVAPAPASCASSGTTWCRCWRRARSTPSSARCATSRTSWRRSRRSTSAAPWGRSCSHRDAA